MDNDLMARRLRPPSEPTRPQNGHSPFGTEDAPWSTGNDLRAEIPWDRPAEEAWPPAEVQWSDADEPVAAQTWPPVPQAPVPAGSSDAVPTEAFATPGSVTPVEAMTAAPEPMSTTRDAADAAPAGTEFFAMSDEPFEAPAPLQVNQAPPVSVAPQAANRPTTWDDLPAPWDEPADSAPTTSASSDASAAETVPSADVTSAADTVASADVASAEVAEPVAVAEAAPTRTGQATWDGPEPVDVSEDIDYETNLDDRPADMFASWDDGLFADEPELATAAVEPDPDREAAAAAVVAGTAAVAAVSDDDAPPWAPAEDSADPDDAFAPVLGDIEQPAPPPWAAWTDEPAATAQATAVAPADAASAFGPTPPDDLFVESEADADGEAEVEADGQAAAEADADAQLDADAAPALDPALDVSAPEEAPPETDPDFAPAAVADVALPFSSTPAGQPVIVRIEVAIVDGNAVVRPVGHTGQAEPLVQSATPRHPEFEPRNHLNGSGATLAAIPEATTTPAPWLLPIEAEPEAVPDADPHVAPAPEPQPIPQPQSAWTMLSEDASAEDPWANAAPARPVEDPWATADPMSSWVVQPATADLDPLTSLPAASISDEPQDMFAPAGTAPVAAAAALTAPAPAAQQDLWFLSSEPETLTADHGEKAAQQPSSAMTAGLTILMAVVVIGLVIAFLWLMTSLPILR